MPKQEVGSTKWLGNKMKAKGLQKLRWYCQMCQKQCRDENGFKCHRMSDGHQRQMQCFVQDPNKFMDEFSIEFEKGFMHLMSHSYRSTRVLANTVYCDFISNRHHTHMNSTIWVTLSNFVQYLGRTNQCKIDKTPKGWYIQYIDNSPEARLREQQRQEMEKSELNEEQRHAKMLADQIEDGKAQGGFQESEFTELQRQEGDAPISFAMGGSSSSSAAAAKTGTPVKQDMDATGESAKNILAQAFSQHSATVGGNSTHRESKLKEQQERKMSAMESLRLEHEASKRRKVDETQEINIGQELAKQARVGEKSPSSSEEAHEPWLAAGLVVKVMHQELAKGKYYRKKGKIEKVYDKVMADVRMLESKDLIRIEQELLETVIPNVGKPVRIVKGTHKGWRATMKAVDFEGFCVTVELHDGTIMDGISYDELCKVEE